MSPSPEWRVKGGSWPTHAGQSEAARQLLADLVGGEAAVEHDSQGAPYLPSRPDLHISISHCPTAVAVAVSAHEPVGIDIESQRRIGEGLIRRVCTPDEGDTVDRSDDPTMAFLGLWTRKEAVLKCLGTGIKGFESMVTALTVSDITVQELTTDLPDTVAALAFKTEF